MKAQGYKELNDIPSGLPLALLFYLIAGAGQVEQAGDLDVGEGDVFLALAREIEIDCLDGGGGEGAGKRAVVDVGEGRAGA